MVLSVHTIMASGNTTHAQLILTIHDLLIRKDTVKLQTDVGILDFAKAFNKVPHGRLLNKLGIFGIDGEIAQWISGFLRYRTQAVVVDGSMSSQASVPQASVPLGCCKEVRRR